MNLALVEIVKREFNEALFTVLGRFPESATPNDLYLALALAARRELLRRSVRTSETYYRKASRTVVYLSAEFLLGPHLANNLLNLGVEAETRQAMSELGYDLDRILAQEEEPGLGNGGLGRLAACYMDSLATLAIPAIGYGIRYEFGIFDQLIHDGWQVEKTDNWLRSATPGRSPRPEIAFDVGLGGRTEPGDGERARYGVRWLPERVVRGVAYDTPILGYRNGTANMLRLWKAEAAESFDLAAFNVGDYCGAVEEKVASENITKVLYPNDEQLRGKQLRLEQQYFFVSCALQDMIRIHLQKGAPLSRARRQVRGPAQRHPPGARGGRADAAPGRRARARLGRGVGDHAPHLRLHEPHAAARGARDVAGRAVRGACCRATSRSSTRSTGASSTSSGERYPGDDARAGAAQPDRRERRRARCAWPTSRASAATASTASPRCTPSCSRATCCATSTRSGPRSSSTSRTASRRGASWLLANPRLARLISEAIGDGWPRDLDGCASSSRWPRTRPSAQSGARRSAPTRPPRGARRGAHGCRVRPRQPVRRAGQAHPRVQAPAPERCCT